jgi:hypothetical protein
MKATDAMISLKLPCRPSGGPRIRFQAFTRWTLVGFPIEAPTRVRIATFSARHPFLSSRP